MGDEDDRPHPGGGRGPQGSAQAGERGGLAPPVTLARDGEHDDVGGGRVAGDERALPVEHPVHPGVTAQGAGQGGSHPGGRVREGDGDHGPTMPL